jgi:hypothetical protein
LAIRLTTALTVPSLHHVAARLLFSWLVGPLHFPDFNDPAAFSNSETRASISSISIALAA